MEEPPTHYPFGAKWERTTRPSPVSSTAMPASTKAARIDNDGSSGKVETTIPHPASNSRKPASLILICPDRSPQKAFEAEEMNSCSAPRLLRGPLHNTVSQFSEN